MIKKEDKNEIRKGRHSRIRGKINGSSERPRLNVYRSSTHIYAQVIDDVKGHTLASSSSLNKDLKIKGLTKTEVAKTVGADVAQKALKAGIKEVVFDRGGYLYTGRIQALADAARQAGLKF